MKKKISTTLSTIREIPRIMADMSVAESHPSTINEPEADAGIAKRLMHSVHAALIASGRLASRKIDRKTPAWPVRGESISVLGYGAEKIAYRVSSEGEKDVVVSVYHREALSGDPIEVASRKRANYDIYKKYFGSLVVSTIFTVIDNPWGEGRKPATIAPYLEATQEFSRLSKQEVRAKTAADPQFLAQLEQLETGYAAMRGDDLVPDFASSNLLVSSSQILIFDTGSIYSTAKLPHLANLHTNYEMLDSLAEPAVVK